MGKTEDRIRNRRLGRLACLLLLFLAASPPVQAAGIRLPDGEGAGQAWEVKADRVVYRQAEETYTASGSVLIRRGETILSADRVEVDRRSLTASASGRVKLQTGEDYLSGSHMTFDLRSQTGTVSDGLIYIEKKSFYIRGDRIEKTGPATYHVNAGSFTTCSGIRPDWRITGRDLSVHIGGYGTVRHAALWAKGLPVAYVPYFLFPVKRSRQSGFLSPEIGYSDRNGFEWIQPYFLALSRSLDATLYYHHIENRGEKPGLELRYALSPESRGTLMADAMKDRKTDTGEPGSGRWGYTDDDYPRPNSDRYWIRMKADQSLPLEMRAKLDIDVVSDQDYLREFEDRLTGYDEADAYFESEFGRGLEDPDEPVRENRLNLNRVWPRYSFNADLRWYDDVVKRRMETVDDTLQQLPTVMMDALKQPLAESPFYLQAASEYTHFYRRDGVSGHRLDIHPRLFLPLQWGRFLAFEPSAGIRQTSWYVDPPAASGQDEAPAGENRDQHRTFYDLGASISTDLFRVYNKENPGAEPVKHTIIPELAYSYVPDQDQSEYPDFDMIDRLGAENRLALSLTHLLTRRLDQKGGENPAGAPDPAARPRYNRFFRFLIEQAYDFNHQKTPGTDPFEPLYAEIEATPARLLSLRAEAQWGHAENALLSHRLSGRLRDERGDYLDIEYRYFRDRRHTIDLRLGLSVTPRIRISGEYERNLEDDTDIEKQLQFLYQAQCWSVACAWSDDETDQRVSGMIRLHGLGGIGEAL
jgi:LPS-assembly protein